MDPCYLIEIKVCTICKCSDLQVVKGDKRKCGYRDKRRLDENQADIPTRN